MIATHILVGHDGSRDAETAFEDALDLAALARARLSVVSVARPPEPPTEVEVQAAIESATAHYEKLFESLRRQARGLGAGGARAPMTEPVTPDAIPSGAGSAVGHQLQRLAQIASEVGDDALASEARAESERLLKSRFFVACLGQFKRGKSTLLNALTGRPILPVGVVPVTSVVTILHDGEHPAATVRFADGRSEPVAVDAIAMYINVQRRTTEPGKPPSGGDRRRGTAKSHPPGRAVFG